MLLLGGTLTNASVRATPRVSWWITAQHLLYASSVAPDATPEPIVKDPKEHTRINQDFPNELIKDNIKKSSLITAAFNSLLLSSTKLEDKVSDDKVSETSSSDLLDEIKSTDNLNKLLQLTKHPKFSKENALIVITILCNWLTEGKIKMEEIENDNRYRKVCRLVSSQKHRFSDKWKIQNHNADIGEFKSPLSRVLAPKYSEHQLKRLCVDDMISVVLELANKQERTVPLLQLIYSRLLNKNLELNVKQHADILYSMAVLNYFHDELMIRICSDLLDKVSQTKKSAVIGSIITSLGLLRYRDEPLLNIISTWMVENKDVTRSQEITSLLMTLAFVGYTTKNFDQIFENLILPLKESDMCQSSEWLDIVWALTVLNKATPQHYESILNEGFINRIVDTTSLSRAKLSKLQNVNAGARLLVENYKGPFIPDDLTIFDTSFQRSKEKMQLVVAVTSALKILLPTDSIYLNTNIDTKMGFLYDAEFSVDSKCTPFPVCRAEKDQQLFRIAVLTCNYNEFCRKERQLIGPVKLYQQLLEKQNYKVLLVPYTDVNIRDKLVTRVKYINENVKKLVQNDSTQ